MYKEKNEFKQALENSAQRYIGKNIDKCSYYEMYSTIVQIIVQDAKKTHASNVTNDIDKKKVYYFSMEFLIGRLLKNYLINLQIEDVVKESLKDYNFDLDKIYDLEKDPGLGNGGLGRLAACFLDSMAFNKINATGMGLKYRFGLFKQEIVNGFQEEVADDWLDKGYPWATTNPALTKIVKFGGYVDKVFENGKINFYYKGYDEVLAVPSDVPIIGYDNSKVNNLRLWYAQPKNEHFDLNEFNKGEYSKAIQYRNKIEAITSILYPDDSNEIGKMLRLQQEYLLVSAGIQDIVHTYIKKYGDNNWSEFSKRIAIHINDTHPTMCIPELMRVLMDDEKLEWDEAWEITKETIAYTNHTVMPEALEKWPIKLFLKYLPRVYMIIEEIDRRYKSSIENDSNKNELIKNTAILWDGNVRMANLSCIGSHSINGVAALHTDIIKKDTLADFYKIFPNKFNNKTNGVSYRRFLLEANPELSKLIISNIGKDWIYDASKLEDLNRFVNDDNFLNSLSQIKYFNKVRLSNYIMEYNKIKVDPTSIFDIQVKRIHAYKRQLLNAFKILYLYNEIKQNPSLDINPYTFVFAGKAAGSYSFAKKTIKLINNLADIINNDQEINNKLKVVFIENFCVSNAEIIYPACEISEQISTAGKEASGTGNMKFMFNGAITLGTMDGANVEINRLVGDDNMQIFGLKENEIINIRQNNLYNSRMFLDENPKIKLITEQLVNGFFDIYGENEKAFDTNPNSFMNSNNMNQKKVDYWDIYDELVNYNDSYFVLYDLIDYINKFFILDKKYNDKKMWNQMSLINIAKSGFFSSDRTIREYAKEIWNV
ncbi:MAG: glycogen/starch/alpha-glucan phosphorylase [Eubacteriales bacterium]|nr:glycogen/starch/alpha-glucan phosphorylase [Eubacteriales bacterium]